METHKCYQFITTLITFIRKFKNIRLNKYVCGQTIALILFSYQIISLTIEYSKYETVLDLKQKINFQKWPSFSFCFDSEKLFKDIIRRNPHNSSVGHYLSQFIDCTFTFGETETNTRSNFCGNSSTIVESLTPFAYRCLTYKSGLIIRHNSHNFELQHKFQLKNSINMFLLVHQNTSLPHFHRNKLILNKGVNYLEFTTVNEYLLPFPYQTNCIDYKSYDQKVDSPKSRDLYC